jgi:NAD(P)H-binding
MRVFVAGATGAIGRHLVPRLVAAGHEVVGMTRKESNRAMLEQLGASPVVADALDPDQAADAVGRARPEVIVHRLTAIGDVDLCHLDRSFAVTNCLRTDPTDHLLSAGHAVAVRRFVAQGLGATPRTRTRAGRSRARRTRSTRRRRARCARRRQRSVTWRRRSSRPSGRRGSCCATALSMVQAHRWRRARSSSSWSADASTRWSATWRGVVLHSRRGRGGGDRGSDRARQGRPLQRR